MITNPRSEIEALTWWLVEQFQDNDDLAAAFARMYAIMDLQYGTETVALRIVKRDVETGHWHPRHTLVA